MSKHPSFWARRRAGIEAEAVQEHRDVEAAEIAAQEAALADKDDAEILEEMGLPDPAVMQMGDDFTAFMAREVPERLRNKALRQLWRSNPVLACLDGLNDYDEDFTIGATGNGVIKTSYQVGKGMLAHIEEMARQKEAAEQEVLEAVDDETVLAAVEEPLVDVVEDVVEEQEVEPIETDVAFAPKRMRFHFAEAEA